MENYSIVKTVLYYKIFVYTVEFFCVLNLLCFSRKLFCLEIDSVKTPLSLYQLLTRNSYSFHINIDVKYEQLWYMYLLILNRQKC